MRRTTTVNVSLSDEERDRLDAMRVLTAARGRASMSRSAFLRVLIRGEWDRMHERSEADAIALDEFVRVRQHRREVEAAELLQVEARRGSFKVLRGDG